MQCYMCCAIMGVFDVRDQFFFSSCIGVVDGFALSELFFGNIVVSGDAEPGTVFRGIRGHGIFPCAVFFNHQARYV